MQDIVETKEEGSGGTRRSDGKLALLLFAHEPAVIAQAIAVGIENVMIDCEWKGKVDRQLGADTDTSFVPLERAKEAAAVPESIVSCRINRFGSWTDHEIEIAIESGASRIFLPMVRSMKEAEHFLQRIDGRVRPAILVETDEAVRIAADLAGLSFDSVYVGLNDLAISRGRKVIFESLLDGTVESLREVFEAVPSFGFGGVTIVGCGVPVPSRLLVAEMHRLECNFSFLRRSYYRDIVGKDVAEELHRLHAFWSGLDSLAPASRAQQKQELDRLISKLMGVA